MGKIPERFRADILQHVHVPIKVYVALTVVTFYGVVPKYNTYVISSIRKFLIVSLLSLDHFDPSFVHSLVLRASSHSRHERCFMVKCRNI